MRRLGARAALALLVAASGCRAERGGPTPTEARNEVVARGYVDAWEAGDADALLELFAPDAYFDDFPNQVQHQGIQEIVAYVTQTHAWATGVDVDATVVHPSERGATIEWVFSAIQEGPIGTLAPVATGRDVVLNGVTVLEISGGRIRRAADYIDVLPLLLQLGGEVRMPGGGVIRLDDVLYPDTLEVPEP